MYYPNKYSLKVRTSAKPKLAFSQQRNFSLRDPQSGIFAKEKAQNRPSRHRSHLQGHEHRCFLNRSIFG
ncbi:unnamed protein product [Bursaphelenchus xylophilus]|nr:unnamed protein product [Bursaphelenchus xylophilus]CAG9122916.1 unnamed protein product [Bursaphelenchus xylophilus]